MNESNCFEIKCKRYIAEYFSITDPEIKSVGVAGGSNSHTRLELDDGTIFGIKMWNKAISLDGSELDCAARDCTFNLIAAATEIVVARDVRYCLRFDYGDFEGHNCAIAKWAPASVPLGEFSSAVTNGDIDFKDVMKPLFCDYGKWAQLASSLGFRDWIPNNFVWSSEWKRLLLVDMDWAFDCGAPPDTDLSSPLKPIKYLIEKDSQTVLSYLKEGATSMNTAMQSHSKIISSLLAASNCKRTAKYKIKSLDNVAENTFERLGISSVDG